MDNQYFAINVEVLIQNSYETFKKVNKKSIFFYKFRYSKT